MKQLGSTTQEAENRKAVLDMIANLQTTLNEADWLSTYEDDPYKYKVGNPWGMNLLPMEKTLA